MDSIKQYEAKKAAIVEQFAHVRASKETAKLVKDTSNLFRHNEQPKATLDVRSLNAVISVDVEKRILDVEGMTTYETIVTATLPFGLIPAVVPELKTITVGGVYAGIGVETTSGKYGFMHETVLEAEILTGDGEVLVCSEKKNADLFFGFPNTYGTLGYALRLKLQLFPCKPFVKLTRTTYPAAALFVEALSEAGKQTRAKSDIAFVEGTVLAKAQYVVTLGTYVNTAHHTRNIYKKPFYQTIGTETEDYLTTYDYLFRYDPDWFWCSQYLGMENPFIRALIPKRKMRSDVYYKIARATGKLPVMKFLRKYVWRREPLIQDVEVPYEKTLEFIEWFDKEIGMTPYIVAPVQQYRSVIYPLSPISPGKQFLNIGFYAPHKTRMPDLYYTKRIDQKVLSMHVRKMLYSVTTLSEEEFWTLFPQNTYQSLKKKYDPQGTFKTLYEKITQIK